MHDRGLPLAIARGSHAARPSGNWPRDRPHRVGDGLRPVRAGSAWPLVSDRSVRRDSGVKRDFACTFTRRLSPVLVALRSQSRLMLEGRARTLSGPSPDLSQATTLATSGRSKDLLIRSHPCGHPDPFRSVRDLGCFPARCSCTSKVPEGCSPGARLRSWCSEEDGRPSLEGCDYTTPSPTSARCTGHQ